MTSERLKETSEFFRTLQSTICDALEKLDGRGTFSNDAWKHEGDGGGITRVLSGGDVFEKGAVNFSRVAFRLTPVTAERLGVAIQGIAATGVSLILHPGNPFVPAVHANVRFLELERDGWWFGGGADLTPSYLFEDDAVHFHGTFKRVCDAYDTSYYPTFKEQADRYFHIPHRGETRGIGGLFFDDLKGEFNKAWAFVRACGSAILASYIPIVERRRETPFEERHRSWQLQRRGRYAEFNLRYDRGTTFGLDTGGRVESILASLPPAVRWDYDVPVTEGSEEARLIEVLRHPREWA